MTFVFFFGGEIPYTILYTSLVILPISVIYTLAAYASLSFRGYPDNTDVVKGGRFNIVIDIKNKWPLFFPYINVLYRETEEFELESGDMTMSIGPFVKTGCVAALTS